MYRIEVAGELGGRFSAAFGDMAQQRTGGRTILTGWLADQCALNGVLEMLRDLGVQLLSITTLADPEMPEPEGPERRR